MTNLEWLRSLSAEDIGKLFGRDTICEYIEEHDATWCHCRMYCDICGIYCAGKFWKEEDGSCKHYEKWTEVEGEKPHLDTDILEEAGFEL